MPVIHVAKMYSSVNETLKLYNSLSRAGMTFEIHINQYALLRTKIKINIYMQDRTKIFLYIWHVLRWWFASSNVELSSSVLNKLIQMYKFH